MKGKLGSSTGVAYRNEKGRRKYLARQRKQQEQYWASLASEVTIKYADTETKDSS